MRPQSWRREPETLQDGGSSEAQGEKPPLASLSSRAAPALLRPHHPRLCLPVHSFFYFKYLYFFKFSYFSYLFLGVLGLHCGAWASHCGGFSCCGARALGTRDSVVAAGSNPCPLHWQADSQPLRHQGSPPPPVHSCHWMEGLLDYHLG